MSLQSPPPRLFVILAKDAEEAVVFRRGPTDWFHIIRWNMKDDSFIRGAWIKGTIYPKKCDLSPNGKLLLYAVLQMRKWRTDAKYSSYTAISRLPWLKALVLWPESGTWGGGGRFTSNSHVVLHSSGCVVHPDHADPSITFSDGSVEYHRSSAEVDGADWTGRDHAGRLIYAKDGLIYRRLGSGVELELADLRDMAPDPIPAPEYADGPLQRGGKHSDI